jgi:hypothetical protein
LPAQSTFLTERECLADFRLSKPGDGEVEIVAAEQEMSSHVGTGEFDAISSAVYANQSEIAGTAPDVANKYGLSVE